MTLLYALAALVTLSLFVYLFLALFKPELFE